MASSFLASSTLAAASSSLTAVFSTRSSYIDFSMLSILLQIWVSVELMAARVASIVGVRVGEGGSWLFFWGPIYCHKVNKAAARLDGSCYQL